MNLKDTYNKIARDWVADHDSDDWWVEGAERFIALLPAGAEVFDVGCGGGLRSAFLADHGLKVSGSDFSEEMVKIAQERLPNFDFRVLDLYNVDTIGKKFDAVFAQAVFLHIPKKDVPEIFKKAKKIIKEGGLFYVVVKERREGALEESIETENDYGYEYKRFFSYFSVPELEKFLTDAGFEILNSQVVPAGKTRWIQIIAKC